MAPLLNTVRPSITGAKASLYDPVCDGALKGNSNVPVCPGATEVSFRAAGLVQLISQLLLQKILCRPHGP